MARTARQRSSSQAITVPLPPSNNSTTQSKHHERIIKEANQRHRKLESYLADDENFPSFALQLEKIGLELRDIPGDGNCLFRALGDQIEGHGRNHYKHRCLIVNYMYEHRSDFEPFVESDIPFPHYLQNLQKLGTYAGNDAIMAFARLHSVDIVIHQLNAPSILIHGSDSHHPHQIHLAYHNGDHYSSVRALDDNTESPTTIHLQVPQKSSVNSVKVEGQTLNPSARELHVMRLSGCDDREMARQALEQNDWDTGAAIVDLMQHMELLHMVDGSTDEVDQSADADSGIWSENGTASRIFGGVMSGNTDSGAKPKHMSKKDRKLVKKQLKTDRHRQTVTHSQRDTSQV